MKKRMITETTLKKMATALRMLSVDMIEKAGSGHPGSPLGLADVVTVLWSQFLKFDSSHPKWFNRDRFILSGGHASAMLYSLLYLTGFEDISLNDLQCFRQLGSKTAGHPEKTLLSGIDFSTGPLGQGVAGGVGMALAERIMNARFGDNFINHKTYIMCGDGDLMEGGAEEAISLAGLWQLKNLIMLWDNNHITIDGHTNLSVGVDMKKRFEAHHWTVLSCDGHNYESISKALDKAQKSNSPVLIDCRTTIGFGAPTKSDTPKCHGSPLGAEEIAGLRQNLGWNYAPFEIPDDILESWRSVGRFFEGDRRQWDLRLQHSGHQDEFYQMLDGQIPVSLSKKLLDYKKKLIQEKQTVATRKASQGVLSVLAEQLPNLIGGSADLSAACYTNTPVSKAISQFDFDGTYINYGVREMAMAGIMNGLSAYGYFIPYGGTFLSFVDYMKGAIRLGALMELREIFVLTHDSLGVGEDGPTHQPIEQLSGLRATPNILVFRPADSVETAECYELALNHKTGPSVLALSRQALPVIRNSVNENKSAQGGYVIYEPTGNRQATLIATGSEVSLALKAKDLLEEKGIKIAVISMPCVELFEKQTQEYQNKILGTKPRIIVEAGSTSGWYRLLQGYQGTVIGIDSFGASGKGGEVMAYFGFTPEKIAETVLQFVE